MNQEDNLMTVEFYFETNNGNKWLAETVKAKNKAEILSLAKQYYNNHKDDEAKSLLDHWVRHGENVILYATFDIKCICFDKTGITYALCNLFDELES